MQIDVMLILDGSPHKIDTTASCDWLYEFLPIYRRGLLNASVPIQDAETVLTHASSAPLTPDAISPTSVTLSDPNAFLLSRQQPRLGNRVIDYAHRVAQKHLIGKKFRTGPLTDLMMAEGWASKASSRKMAASSVKTAIRNDPAFVRVEPGIWTYELPKANRH